MNLGWKSFEHDISYSQLCTLSNIRTLVELVKIKPVCSSSILKSIPKLVLTHKALLSLVA